MVTASTTAAVIARQRENFLWDCCLLVVLSLLSFSMSAVWFVGSDDAAYIGWAREWLHHFPYVSPSFGGLRYPVILPIAGCFALFGDSELTAAIPTLVYATGSVLLIYICVRRLIGREAAILSAALVLLSPLLGELSATVGDDVPELFFGLLSLFLFLLAEQKSRGVAWYFYAGLSAGAAFECHESAVALVAFFGLLFVFGCGRSRWNYWVIGSGFLSILLLEAAFYWIEVGDPLFHFHAAAGAMRHPDSIEQNGHVDLTSVRVLHFSRLIDPFIFSLLHPKLLLVFPLGCVAFYSMLKGPQDVSFRRFIVGSILLFVSIEYLIACYVLGYLNLLPRYFLTPAVATLVVIGIWLAAGLRTPRRPVYASVFIVLVAVAMLGQIIADKSPRYAERRLATAAQELGSPIYTDPNTRFRGSNLYRWSGVTDLIKVAAPGHGDLFFYNPDLNRADRPNSSEYMPKPDWIVVRRFERPLNVFGRLLNAVGLSGVLSPALMARLSAVHPPSVLYRIP